MPWLVPVADAPTVLLVEDERLMRLAVGYRLARDGFLVDVAETALEAMEVLGRRTYDVVVTDLRFDSASGLDVVRTARRLQPASGVILLAGSAEPEELREGLRAGAAAVLVKPCALADLAREARKVVRAAEGVASRPFGTESIPFTQGLRPGGTSARLLRGGPAPAGGRNHHRPGCSLAKPLRTR